MNRIKKTPAGLYCRSLKESDKATVYETFKLAFADYHLDMSYMTEEVIFNRAVKNGVCWDLSVGAFHQEQMVGFIQIGLDNWKGKKAAFDAGTGIIPDYRGKGLAGQMFSYIKEKLKKNGVKILLLEVLQVNKKAIRAYQKAGFKITREFEGLKIEPKNYLAGKMNKNILIDSGNKDMVSEFESALDWLPSWENSGNTIRRIPDEIKIYSAIIGRERAGILVYYPLLKWIMVLVVKPEFRNLGIASTLLNIQQKDLSPHTPEVKLLNIEKKDQIFLSFIKKRGFKNYANQFEMELKL